MVSPWMDNGNLNSYLQQHSTALTLAARFKLLCDISTGLQYLHQRNIIHGDLTGANVLISDDSRACLGDFGMSKIIAEFQGSSHMTTSIHTNLRWSAPEACGIDSDPSVTFFTDVYSFGSVMLQVLSGRIPYHYLKYEPQVLRCLVNHIRPQRPAENVTDIYWGFIQRCWVDNPRARPGVSEILAAITYFHHNLLDRPSLSPSSSWIGSENLGIPCSVVVPIAQNINANTNTLLQVAQAQDSASRPYHDADVKPVWAVSPRVLLVDDDAVVQKLSTRLLRIFGCIIDSATDGAAAVDKMNNAIYDLVFMDIMMPKLDGVSATCLIRKFDTLTPIISMTSNSKNADVQIYYTSGMNDVLCKPFDKGRVLTILEKHLVHLKAMQGLSASSTSRSFVPPCSPLPTIHTASGPGVQVHTDFQGLIDRCLSISASAPPPTTPGVATNRPSLPQRLGIRYRRFTSSIGARLSRKS